MLRHFPAPPPFIGLPLDEFRPVDMFGRQSIMGRAQEAKELLVVTAKDGKRPLVVYLKTGPRPTSPPIIAFEFTLMVSTGVDPLDGLGGERIATWPTCLSLSARPARHFPTSPPDEVWLWWPFASPSVARASFLGLFSRGRCREPAPKVG